MCRLIAAAAFLYKREVQRFANAIGIYLFLFHPPSLSLSLFFLTFFFIRLTFVEASKKKKINKKSNKKKDRERDKEKEIYEYAYKCVSV